MNGRNGLIHNEKDHHSGLNEAFQSDFFHPEKDRTHYYLNYCSQWSKMNSKEKRALQMIYYIRPLLIYLIQKRVSLLHSIAFEKKFLIKTFISMNLVYKQ